MMKKLIMVLTLAGLVVPATFAFDDAPAGDKTQKVEKKKKNKKKVSKGNKKAEEPKKGG